MECPKMSLNGKVTINLHNENFTFETGTLEGSARKIEIIQLDNGNVTFEAHFYDDYSNIGPLVIVKGFATIKFNKNSMKFVKKITTIENTSRIEAENDAFQTGAQV